MIPAEREVAQVMRDTGMERMQAVNHLRGRQAAIEVLRRKRLAAMRDERVECPDCFDGYTDFGKHCWTCEGAGFWMQDMEQAA